jgi:hypothetical protein
MTNHAVDASQRKSARMAGLLYLILFATGVFTDRIFSGFSFPRLRSYNLPGSCGWYHWGIFILLPAPD